MLGALVAMASRLSTRTAQIAHNALVRTIRQAERDDLVGRNVAALVDTPKAWAAQVPLKPSDAPGADIAAPRHGRSSVRYGQ